ncbi:MAG: thioredoxin domain-containing protein [Thermoplasmata archaeon]
MAEERAAAPSGHRLKGAASGYLASAAAQPIDWYPWGPEPFERARRLHRPILLDIGAAWCHWCHVMDEGTYSDPEVAEILGREFVAIKVDRDERPEIDRRYQQEVGVLSGEGGWPLTAFLDPDGAAFFGGTYFPPTDGHGRPGFRRVLREIARIYRDEGDQVRETTRQVLEALSRIRQPPTAGAGPVPPVRFVARVEAEIIQRIDPLHGGFGPAPKFPHPAAHALLLLRAQVTGESDRAEPVLYTLRQMADGGIYDQLGGGFHRYSVDEAWHIPHFEKMAIDNAALLDLYLEAARYAPGSAGDPTIDGIIDWTRTALVDPAGGFASSQDADAAPGDDGDYYTWSRAEIQAVVPAEEARFAVRLFGVGADGRMPHDPERNVLYRALSPADAATGVLPPDRDPDRAASEVAAALRAARNRRIPPTVDPALYGHINGRYIGAFARASLQRGKPSLREIAVRAADRWLTHGVDPDRGVAHRIDAHGGHGFGHLEDNAHFALGLIDLALLNGEPRYAEAVGPIVAKIVHDFPDDQGRLRDLAPRLYDGSRIGGELRPTYPFEDQPHLGAGPAAVRALHRWAQALESEELDRAARRLWEPMAARTMDGGLFSAGVALVGAELDLPGTTVIVEGEGPEADALARAAWSSPRSNLVVFRGAPPPPFRVPAAAGTIAGGSTARALVCVGVSCRAPITKPGELSRTLAAPPGPG